MTVGAVQRRCFPHFYRTLSTERRKTKKTERKKKKRSKRKGALKDKRPKRPLSSSSSSHLWFGRNAYGREALANLIARAKLPVEEEKENSGGRKIPEKVVWLRALKKRKKNWSSDRLDSGGGGGGGDEDGEDEDGRFVRERSIACLELIARERRKGRSTDERGLLEWKET